MKKELKQQILAMRRSGKTYTEIEQKLRVARSTLDYWLKDVVLSEAALSIIKKKKEDALQKAREKAALMKKNLDRETRELVYKETQKRVYLNEWPLILNELILAALYLGEGFKRRSTIGLGNSNHEILVLFVNLLRRIYKVNEDRFHCALYLRADQNEKKEKVFWSNKLDIDIGQFQKTQFDKRTLGKKTWENYHGVCAVYYNDATVEKKLTALQKVLLEKFSGA